MMVRVNAPGQCVPKMIFDEPVGAVHNGFVEVKIVHGSFLCVPFVRLFEFLHQHGQLIDSW